MVLTSKERAIGLREMVARIPGNGDVVRSFASRAVRLFSAMILASSLSGCGPSETHFVETPRPATLRVAADQKSGVDEIEAFAKPISRPDDFVGSATCAECHAAIAERYAGHPMAGPIGDAVCGSEGGEAAVEPTSFSVDGRDYQVVCRDGAMVHVERVMDNEGILYEQAVPVRFALGSGTRGKTYLVDRGGKLFQSPIGWYAGNRGYGLSPGYREDPGLRFERAIGDGCLVCHAGRLARDVDRPGRYTDGVFLERSIGCERCHGPGERHVAAMRVAKSEGLEPTVSSDQIVNPSRLDPERREAVCNQCHLIGEAVIPRRGRGFFDYRPGDLLDDTRIVLVKAGQASRGPEGGAPSRQAGATGGDRAVSHVEQMRESRCYVGSQGRLGCTSCHDPHGVPDRQSREAFYRSRCNACHADESCGLIDAEREAAPFSGSCISCHMPPTASRDVPHTAVTDHRVRRRPATMEADHHRSTPSRSDVAGSGLTVFGGAGHRLPRWELERALGLRLAEESLVRRDPLMASQAVESLVPGGADPVALLTDDIDALLAVADILDVSGQMGKAASCRKKVLELDPLNEPALEGLAKHRQRQGDLDDALRYIDRLLKVNPWIAGVHARRAVLLGGLSRWKEGIEAADASLALDPTLLQVRRWLVEACGRAGEQERVEQERSLLSRFEKATRGR